MSMERSVEWLADYQQKVAKRSNAELVEVKRIGKSMSGGVESRHAAETGSTRGGDESHKAVKYWTAGSAENGYKAPLAGVTPGPLTLKYANLLVMLEAAGIPDPIPEYPFASPHRKWRFDWAWPSYRVALEVDGGVWTQGRHTRGQGFIEDQRKLNHAVLLGWKVLRTTPDRFDEAVRDLGFLLVGDAA